MLLFSAIARYAKCGESGCIASSTTTAKEETRAELGLGFAWPKLAELIGLNWEPTLSLECGSPWALTFISLARLPGQSP